MNLLPWLWKYWVEISLAVFNTFMTHEKDVGGLLRWHHSRRKADKCLEKNVNYIWNDTFRQKHLTFVIRELQIKMTNRKNIKIFWSLQTKNGRRTYHKTAWPNAREESRTNQNYPNSACICVRWLWFFAPGGNWSQKLIFDSFFSQNCFSFNLNECSKVSKEHETLQVQYILLAVISFVLFWGTSQPHLYGYK